MQQIEDRLLFNYSYSTNPTMAMATLEAAKKNQCHAVPETNHVFTQVYIHRLSHIDQRDGTYEIEGYLLQTCSHAHVPVVQGVQSVN